MPARREGDPTKDEVIERILGPGPYTPTGFRTSQEIRDEITAFQPILQARFNSPLRVSQGVTAGWLIIHGFRLVRQFDIRPQDMAPERAYYMQALLPEAFKHSELVPTITTGATIESRLPTLIQTALFDLKAAEEG